MSAVLFPWTKPPVPLCSGCTSRIQFLWSDFWLSFSLFFCKKGETYRQDDVRDECISCPLSYLYVSLL